MEELRKEIETLKLKFENIEKRNNNPVLRYKLTDDIILYNLKVYEFYTLGCNLTPEMFIKKLVIKHDELLSGTINKIKRLSWIDQIVLFIEYGYARYHPTEPPLQFVGQPNGSMPIIFFKTIKKNRYSSKEEQIWTVCGDYTQYYKNKIYFHDLGIFLENVAKDYYTKLQVFDPSYTPPDMRTNLTDEDKIEILKKLSLRVVTTPDWIFANMRE